MSEQVFSAKPAPDILPKTAGLRVKPPATAPITIKPDEDLFIRRFSFFLSSLDAPTGFGVIKLTKSGVTGSPFHVDITTGFKLLTAPNLFKFQTKE